jgi:hypothetical protein
VAKDLAVERARVVRGAVVVRVLLLFGLFMVLYFWREEGVFHVKIDDFEHKGNTWIPPVQYLDFDAFQL